MAKINPCVKDCPRRKPCCRTDCPDWAEAQALREKLREDRKRELLIGSYFKDSVYKNSRRRRR